MKPKTQNKRIIKHALSCLFVLLFFCFIVFLYETSAFAVQLESGIPIQGSPLAAGQEVSGLTISQFIKYMYYFVLGIVGVAVFASLVFWGVVWISSGIVDKRAMALGKIKDAFFGLAIALGAFIILNTINPDLLKLKDPEIIPTKGAAQTRLIAGNMGSCASTAKPENEMTSREISLKYCLTQLASGSFPCAPTRKCCNVPNTSYYKLLEEGKSCNSINGVEVNYSYCAADIEQLDSLKCDNNANLLCCGEGIQTNNEGWFSYGWWNPVNLFKKGVQTSEWLSQ